jgi:hypothetical protein
VKAISVTKENGVTLSDDLRSELERALSGVHECCLPEHEGRHGEVIKKVLPILERLVEGLEQVEYRMETAETERDWVKAKLAAAEAERDGAIADRDEAEKNRNKFERDLQDAQALLARRPHLYWSNVDGCLKHDHLPHDRANAIEECAGLGGACAK